jgi:hypothetical protein
MRLLIGIFLVRTLLLGDTVPVKFQEGAVHGFLALRTLSGKVLASGELTQIVHGELVESRLVFRFKDGSLDEETATFTQRGTFRLLTDHHIQKGPSFPKPYDARVDTSAGTVTVRYREHDHEKVETQHLDLPPDLVNGMIINVIRNISPNTRQTTLSWVEATPKPRLLKLTVTCLGYEPFTVEGASFKAAVFNIKIDLGGILGIIAPLVGKQPSDIRVWVCENQVPAFVKSDGFHYMDGPIWSIQLASPVWQ